MVKTKSTSLSKVQLLRLLDALDKVQKENREIIRRENEACRSRENEACRSRENYTITPARKRTRSTTSSIRSKKSKKNVSECSSTGDDDTSSNSDSQIDSDMSGEEDYKRWRKEEYDTVNSIKRSDLLYALDLLDDASKPEKKSLHNCAKFAALPEADICWSSSTYLIKYIRKCILRHKWKELSHLLPLLLQYDRRYESIVKEVTFLTTLMSTTQTNTNLLEELDLCFAKESCSSKINKFDIWYIQDL